MAETPASAPPPNPNSATTVPPAPTTVPAPAPTTVPAPAPTTVPAQAAGVESKKRKMEIDEFYNSDYCKLRRIVHDLRPLFLQVLRTPDFKKSNVATDIRKQINSMLALSVKMRNDMAPTEKPVKREGESSFEVPPQSGGTATMPSASFHEKAAADAKVAATMPSASFHEKKTADAKVAAMKEIANQLDEKSHGSYVIGGSQVGWNFLLYPQSAAIYYGETKEGFRARLSAK